MNVGRASARPSRTEVRPKSAALICGISRGGVRKAGEIETPTGIGLPVKREDASTETAMVFGELYRNGVEWKFRAVGQGYASGLAGIARDFGVNV